MRRLLLTTIMAGSLWALLPHVATAATITFTDRTLFDAALGAQTTLTFDPQGPPGAPGAQYYGSTLAIGDVTFHQSGARLWILSEDYYGATYASDYLNNNAGQGGLSVTFATPVFGFGADFGYINFGSTNTATFTLSTGEVFSTTLPEVSGGSPPPQFLGFVSSTAFTSFSISGGAAYGVTLDDFSYSSNIAQVPEPGSNLLLLGTGLIGAGVCRWRRRMGSANTD